MKIKKATWLLFPASQHFAVSLTSKPRIERILPANHKRFAGYDIIRHENQIVPLLRLADIFPYLESNQPEKQFCDPFFISWPDAWNYGFKNCEYPGSNPRGRSG